MKDKIKAIALKSKTKDSKNGGQIVAKGIGHLAKKIIEIAKAHNIPIKNDPQLAELLYKLDLLAEIPPHLYSIILEICGFLYEINKEKEKEHEAL